MYTDRYIATVVTDEGTTQTDLTTTLQQRTKAMNLQELQAAIEAYRLTTTTTKQVQQLEELLQEQLGKTEDLAQLPSKDIEIQNWLDAQVKVGPLYYDSNSFEWIESEELHYQVTFEEAGFEFHYWNEKIDETVSIPLRNLKHLHKMIDSLK